MKVIDAEAKVIQHYDSLMAVQHFQNVQNYWSKYTFIYDL